MNSIVEDFDDEMTDGELDVILASVRDNLVTHVRATTSPARTLVAMMAASDDGGQPGHFQPDDVAADSTQLAVRQLGAVIEIRGRAAEVDRRLSEIVGLSGDLAADLDLELNQHADLPIAVRSARAFAQHCDRRLIQLVSRVRDLVTEIAWDLRRVRQLDRDLTVDRDVRVIRELASDVPALDRIFDGIRELDVAYANGRQSDIGEQIKEADELAASLETARRLMDLRERWRNLDKQDARELADAIDVVLKRVDKLASALMYRVHTLEVDVKYADLSDVQITHLDRLTGVFWNERTVWPTEVAREIENASRLVTDGIHQVRPDGQRPAVSLGRHSAERLSVPAGHNLARQRAKRRKQPSDQVHQIG